MRLKFIGAAQTVTASMHLLDVNGTRILLDCGLFQGKRAESIKTNKNFDLFDPAAIDAMMVVILLACSSSVSLRKVTLATLTC